MAAVDTEVVDGLAEFLRSRGLVEHTQAASAWCHDNGAGFLQEVLDNKDELGDFLGLSELERQRLAGGCSRPLGISEVSWPSCLHHGRAFTAPTISSLARTLPLQAPADPRRACGRSSNGWSELWHIPICGTTLASMGLQQPAQTVALQRSKTVPVPKTATAFRNDGAKTGPSDSNCTLPIPAALNSALQPMVSDSNSWNIATSSPLLQLRANTMVRAVTLNLDRKSSLIQQPTALASASTLFRTPTSPGTDLDKAAAEARVSSAYVPLQAWPVFGSVMKTLPAQLPSLPMCQADTAYRRVQEKTVLQPDDDLHIQVPLEKGQMFEANRRYMRPHVSDARLAASVSTNLLSCRRMSASKARPRTDATITKSNFAELQETFKKEYADELHHAFGPKAIISNAPVAQAVQKQFCDELTARPDDKVRLGFHGTRAENYKPIFRTGLRVPGNGGVSVANGSAHGVGIYTARLGGARLSQGFSHGTKGMLVCGIIDEPDDVSMKLPLSWSKRKSQPEQQLLKCGRPPKRPDGEKEPASVGTVQQTMGGLTVAKRTAAVLHVGDAQVIFNERRVVPLLKVEHSGKLYQSPWAPPAAPSASEQEGKKPKNEDIATWLAGNPNFAKPESQAEVVKGEGPQLTRHELTVRRAMAQRLWKQGRREQRSFKAA